MSTRVQVHSREEPASCAYCRGGLGAEDGPVVACEGCQAAYHDDCLAELGACATLGCPAPRPGDLRRAPQRRIQITSPRCCHEARGAIVLCDACGARWHTACLGGAGCCSGHGLTPEEGPVRVRDPGPRPGSLRSCTRCEASFQVRARAPFNPLCDACSARHNRFGLLVIAMFGLLYLAYYGVLFLGSFIR